MNILQFLILILVLLVLIGILNEKIFHVQSDIALILFSLIISLFLLVFGRLFRVGPVENFIGRIGDFGFEKYLMEGVLCFMLFSGASKVNIRKFRQNVRAISLLALLTTMLSSVVYGGLFYLVSLIFGFRMDILTCILLGCVVSPTDPIAATGILNKIGLSKNVCSVIENESLFNDGTGVTLFIFVRSLVRHSGENGFFVLMLKEIGGAVATALVISFLLFKLMELTRDPIRYILISLLDVSLVYMICEHLGFSGVIASVVCGMYFSVAYSKMERRVKVIDPKELYPDFWEIVENLLNAVLFVMIGLTVLNVEISRYFLILLPAAILINALARAFGVSASCFLTGKKNIPGNYCGSEYVALMTWSALKGGLSLALALGTGEFLPKDVYDIFINVTYITIFFTVLVQGLTVKKVYFALEKHKAGRTAKERREKEGVSG
ncbi:MAG: sodium:proton antiporter [Lachnospiraceae bacterium]|nr:sodium:proton antiporter [Lachnospiraceae bacterium]